MHRAPVVLLLAALAVFAGICCTYNEPRLRPEPIAAAQQGWQWNANELTADGMTFRCTEWQSSLNKLNQTLLEVFTGWHSTMDECVYLTAKPETILSDLLATPTPSPGGFTGATAIPEMAQPTPSLSPQEARVQKRARSRVIAARTNDLLAISDYNCDNFLAGAFAGKTGTDFGSNIASTILSGTSSIIGLAGGVPALVPSAISAGNGAITGGTAAFDSNFFAKQSFDIMEAGIVSRRQILRNEIAARLCETFRPRPDENDENIDADPKVGGAVATTTPTPSPDNCAIPASANYLGYIPRPYYTMAQALSDVIAYDRVCSIEGGLRELGGAAAQQQKVADASGGLGGPTPTLGATPAPNPTPTLPGH